MSSTLALASLIATLERSELRELVAGRRIFSPVSVRDPLSLAIELLRQDSISRALQGLDRQSLKVLSGISLHEDRAEPDAPIVSRLRGAGLVGLGSDGEMVPLAEVAAVLQGIGLDFDAAEDAGAVSAETEHPDTSGWYGPALTSVRRSAAALRELARRPVKLSRKGTTTVASQREIAIAIRGNEVEESGRLLDVLSAAGLVAPVPGGSGGQLLAPTTAASAWLTEPYPERWLALATGLAAALDPRVRELVLENDGNLAQASDAAFAHRYPLLPGEIREQAMMLAVAADEFGFSVAGWLSPAALHVLRGETEQAYLSASRDFPAEATGVYLQPDLSLIVPGALRPADEAAVAAITEIEQLGAAAALRLTSSSLTRAVRVGFGTAEIRALLERLSLTGIPQPIDFLLADLERTLVSQAGTAAAAGSSRATSAPTDEAPNIAPDARATVDSDALDDQLEQLIDTVYEAMRASEGAGDLTRKLELAIRQKVPVKVTAAAGSDTREFTLLPVSLNGGRLRATDQLAGVERTLPVSAIVSVEAA